MKDETDQKPFLDPSPFAGAEFVDNPEPRCPCVLLVDTSGSMAGAPIRQLNDALVTFRDELLADDLAGKRVELAVVRFGPVDIVSPFATPDAFVPPVLAAGGETPMGAAIVRAIELVEERKKVYRSEGVSYYRPWIFLITDGAPSDAWFEASRRVHEGEEKGQFSFFAVGVADADFTMLGRISKRAPLRLTSTTRFRDMFAWLSRSLQNVSRSQVGDKVPLENPIAPSGWASIG